jgi:hypothetical protein
MNPEHNEPPCPRLSPFALDLHRAGGGEPEVADHLASCASCRDYLASLDALDVARPRFAGRAAAAPPRTSRWPLAAGVFAMAAGAALVLVARAPDGRYVGVKGLPSVQLLVHRDAETSVWDGAPIRPGDSIAFRVDCQGLAMVTVAGATDGAHWARLKDATCPAGPSAVLPFTLLVDGDGQEERFAAVVSAKALDDAALEAASASTQRADGVWTFRFDLPKTRSDR